MIFASDLAHSDLVFDINLIYRDNVKLLPNDHRRKTYYSFPSRKEERCERWSNFLILSSLVTFSPMNELYGSLLTCFCSDLSYRLIKTSKISR